jgi:predicted DNA-binding protein YlxM (UPF0122 family)
LRPPPDAGAYAKFQRILFGFSKIPLTFQVNSCKIIVVVKEYSFTLGGVSVKNQTFRMTMLYDFYGETLTGRQKEFYDLYYNEDLSLSEIAENYDITRQGVRDVIVRAEKAMTDLEDQTGLLKRFMQMQDKIAAIETAAEAIATINYRQYENPELQKLTETITENAKALKE